MSRVFFVACNAFFFLSWSRQSSVLCAFSAPEKIKKRKKESTWSQLQSDSMPEVFTPALIKIPAQRVWESRRSMATFRPLGKTGVPLHSPANSSAHDLDSPSLYCLHLGLPARELGTLSRYLSLDWIHLSVEENSIPRIFLVNSDFCLVLLVAPWKTKRKTLMNKKMWKRMKTNADECSRSDTFG